MKEVHVGLLFSTDGSYRYMGRSALEGAIFAINEINKSEYYSFKLIAESENAKGIDELYIPSIRNLLKKGVTHFFGPITSSARKILLPEIQKNKAMLWFSSPYEGYECEEQVVYLGPCPNQNLLPLMDYAIPKYGKKIALVSSNYVWGWESSRIAKEIIKANSGDIVFDALFHMQELDFSLCINDILKENPSFIINNLVGESNYSFLKQLSNSLKDNTIMTVLSCNLTECELAVLGDLPNLELISSNPFFESTITSQQSNKKSSLNRTNRSGYFWGAYLSVLAFANAVKLSQSLSTQRIQAILPEVEILSPKGELIKLNQNQHTSLPCTIAMRVNGNFESLLETGMIPPNPFMTFQNQRVTANVIELSSYSKRLKAI
jgi:branched-chain amino acid transport system substrate-binding protein